MSNNRNKRGGRGGKVKTFESVLSETLLLLDKKEWKKASMSAQELVNMDDSMKVGYQLFIRASLGQNDFTAAMMGCYEALDKWPDESEFQATFKMVAAKRKEFEERPLKRNEEIAASKSKWSFQALETISEIIALPNESFAVFSESGEAFVIAGNTVVQKMNLGASVDSASSSPDFKHAAVGTQNGKVIILKDLTTSPSIIENKAGTSGEWVECIKWFQDNQQRNWIVVSIGKILKLFQIENCTLGTCVSLEGHSFAVQSIDWNPKTQELISYANKEVFFWNFNNEVKKSSPSRKFTHEGIFSCRGNVNGLVTKNCITVGARDGTTFFRYQDMKPDRFIGFSRSNDGNSPINAIYVYESGKDMYVASASESIIEIYWIPNQTLKLAKSKCVLKGHRNEICAFAACPTNPAIFASGAKDGTICVWKLTAEDVTLCIARYLPPLVDQIRKLTWLPSGQIIAGFTSGLVAVWDVDKVLL